MSAPDLRSSPDLTEHKWKLLAMAAQDDMLGSREFRVLFAALDHVHRKPGKDFGLLWPSVGTLATAAATNERSVFRALATLSSRGYLIPVTRGGGRTVNGLGRSNVYRMGVISPPATLTEVATLPDVAGLTLTDLTPNPDKSVSRTLTEVADNPLEVPFRKNLKKDTAPLVFEGAIIRLNQADFTKLEKSYSAIPDLRAALTSYDVWLDGNLMGKERQKWWQRMHNKLDAINQEQASRRRESRGNGAALNESF